MSSQTTHFIQTVLRPGSLAESIHWRMERKVALGILLVLVTASLVGWLYLTQASSLTTTSFEIEQIRNELTQVKQQNAQLQLEIAQWEALPRIEQRARELGYAPSDQIQYLPVADYPAVSADQVSTR
jgi:cell division protein FtsL